MIYSIRIRTLTDSQRSRRWRFVLYSIVTACFFGALGYLFYEGTRKPPFEFTKWLGGVSIGIALQATGFAIINMVSLMGHWRLSSEDPPHKESWNSPLPGIHFFGVFAIAFGIIGTPADAFEGFSVFLQALAVLLTVLSIALWIFMMKQFIKHNW